MGINLKKDNYCHLIDYKKGKFFLEGHYHTKCYNDRVKGDPKMKALAMGLLGKANKLLKETGVEEEYELRV